MTYTTEDLRALYHTEPFQAFTLVLNDGKRLSVPTRNRIVIAVGGTHAIVIKRGGDLEFVDVRTIKEIQVGKRKRTATRTSPPKRRKAG